MTGATRPPRPRCCREGGIGELAVAERVFWRDRGALALAHVLMPETRPRWTEEPLGPALAPGLELAEALEAVRAGDLSTVRSLRWPDAGVVRAHLPLAWVVELACAGTAAGNPPPDDLFDAVGARLRPALLAAEPPTAPGRWRRRPSGSPRNNPLYRYTACASMSSDRWRSAGTAIQ